MNKIGRIASICLLSASFSLPSSLTHAADLLPNLQALPAYDLSVQSDFHGGAFLRLSAMTWNNGLGPLQLEGGTIHPDGGVDVLQRIFRDDGSSYTHYAGEFYLQDEHGHIHLEDYADYILTSTDDPTNPTIRRSTKVSFCIIDTDKIDTRLPGAPKKAVYDACDADEQGLSVGWGDAYHSHMPGQAIDISGIPTGDYNLTIASDPLNTILETDETDNDNTILIHLDMALLTVEVLDGSGEGPSDPPTSPGDVAIDSMVPAMISASESIFVTIHGSGFTEGMEPKFENGTGPAPMVSNITVVDGNIITATATAKKGGPPRLRAWDLVVDSGILLGALTVHP